MRALVVYDSFFGNTEQIARAIGEGLGSQAEVEVVRIGELQPEQLAGLGLLVAGSPTRAFSASPDTKAWLKRLAANSLRGVKIAAFDTRVAVADVDNRLLTGLVKIFGYAAEPIASTLVKKGGVQAIAPEGFIVLGTEGPLKEGELMRAAAWGRQILAGT